MSTISTIAITTPHASAALPSHSRSEIVWIVDKTAVGDSILVARWSVQDDESRPLAKAA